MSDLIGRVKQGFDKGVNIVSAKSKEMVEATKVCSQIASLKDQKKGNLQELGSSVFSLHLQGTVFAEEIEEKCQFIADLDKQIQEKEAELEAIHREAKESLGIPFCRKCGEELTEGDQFCRKCGNKVE